MKAVVQLQATREGAAKGTNDTTTDRCSALASPPTRRRFRHLHLALWSGYELKPKCQNGGNGGTWKKSTEPSRATGRATHQYRKCLRHLLTTAKLPLAAGEKRFRRGFRRWKGVVALVEPLEALRKEVTWAALTWAPYIRPAPHQAEAEALAPWAKVQAKRLVWGCHSHA